MDNPNSQTKFDTKYITAAEIYSDLEKCIGAWGETLERLGVKKAPKLDEEPIARLLARHGLDKTVLALRGAGFEAHTDSYDPRKHVSIVRLKKPDLFEKFVNLGASHGAASADSFYSPPTASPIEKELT